MAKKQQNVSKILGSLSNAIVDKLKEYNRDYENLDKEFFTDKEKKDILLGLLELSYKNKNNELITSVKQLVGHENSFETALHAYLGVTIKTFEKYKTDDQKFAIQYSKILQAQYEELVKKALESIGKQDHKPADIKSTMDIIKSANSMLLSDSKNIAAAIPVEQFQKFFWNDLVENRDTLVEVIQGVVNDVVISRAKELLDNTQFSDDGNEVIINKEYERPIKITHNGEDISNECEIQNIENVIFCEKKDIMPVLNAKIIELVASGKLSSGEK